LREVSLKSTHGFLRLELAYLRQASYCAALIEQSTETETPLGPVFGLLAGLITQLPRRPARPTTILAFELKLLAELGLPPDPEDTQLTAGARALLSRLMQWDWLQLEQLRLAPAQTAELSQFLHGYLIYHLGHLAKGREAALTAAAWSVTTPAESRTGDLGPI
jgi:recombinational DNA repair protein (RecF pathway)